MSQHFTVMDTNPNENTRGKGCLCFENGGPDTKGPYVVFNATEMDTATSPYPVLCAGCALKAAADIAPRTSASKPRGTRKAASDDIPEV